MRCGNCNRRRPGGCRSSCSRNGHAKMYEHRSHPLLSRAEFLRRVARHGLLALIVVAFALAIGLFGYHFIGHLSWLDSLLNASMILGGMGPVDPLNSDA